MANLEKASRRFHVLADPIRLRIIKLLQGGEKCVGELTKELNMSQPKVSYHLKLMLSAGLIERRCEGTWCFYSLKPGTKDVIQHECEQLFDTPKAAEG
ncbi:MAG: winged helix-turn-helix transcriptional regulator [Firmicutes bacterium]|nr:winged helix-turn-helix transcriptional regulator [Bacillota bacterium]